MTDLHLNQDDSALPNEVTAQLPPHEICKISVSIRGHRTSFSVERAFFDELSRLATTGGVSLARLVSSIDDTRQPNQNLSSAIRLHVLNALKNGSAAETH